MYIANPSLNKFIFFFFFFSPQIACLWEYKVTLVAFIQLSQCLKVILLLLSALCDIKCFLKLLASDNTKSRWLHLFNFLNVWMSSFFYFSPLCDFKCFLKLLTSENTKSHWLHLFKFPNIWKSSLFDFSPLCVFKCVRKALA